MKSLRYLLAAPLILLITIYRWFISPLFPGVCRHYPTCSEYGKEAVQIHGPLKGSWLTLRRLLKCHPWGTHGVDMVPPKEEKGTN